MPFDRPAARQEFARLVRAGGAPRTDRIPTREDLFARWHWDMEQALIRAGQDPRAADVGRHSSLISGQGSCRPWPDEQPLEKRLRYAPMPLAWFDTPASRHVFVSPDPAHRFLAALAASHLAGYAGRPSGPALYRQLTGGMTDTRERAFMAELLGALREEDYPQLRRRDALSVWHIARAVHACGVRRGALSHWLNQFAERPCGWRGRVPGQSPCPR